MCSCNISKEQRATTLGWFNALCVPCQGKLPKRMPEVVALYEAHLDGSKPLGLAKSFQLQLLLCAVKASL